MSNFFQEVGILFGLSRAQSDQLEKNLFNLIELYHRASNKDTSFFRSYYEKFVTDMIDSGLKLNELPRFLHHLYFSDHGKVVTYIVPSYYKANHGDKKLFLDIYELMH